jgi:hypothetical protein
MSDIWQQVRGGYADQGFTLPQDELPARVRRRRQRAAATGVAAAVLIVATGGAVAAGGGGGEGAPVRLPVAASPPGERLDAADYLAEATGEAVADCLARAGSLPGGVAPFTPEEVFGFADEHQWFTLLVSEEHQVGCWAATGDEDADVFITGGEGHPAGWLGDRPLPAFRHNTSRSDHTSQSYLVGLAPPDTMRVEVVLWDGTVVEAVLASDWFAAWLPGATGQVFVDMVSEVTAYTAGGPVSQVDDLSPPGAGGG